MAQSILYYPTINIEDGAWLRSATLYWDEVCSIVPYEEFEEFSPEIMYLQERGMYRPLYTENIFSMSDPCELAFRVKQFFKNEQQISCKRKKFNPISNTCDQQIETLIHCNKIPEETRQWFLDNKIAMIQKDDWLVMDKNSALRYMRFLAEFAVKYDQQDMVLGTDKECRISQIYPVASHVGRYDLQNNIAVSLILDRCLPIPAQDVSFEKILDFKNHRKEDLMELRNKIRTLERDLSSCESIEHAKSIIIQFRESWEKELFMNKKMFIDDKVGFALGSIRSFIADAGATAGLLQWVKSSGYLNVSKSAMGVIVGMAGLIGIGAYSMNYRRRIRDEHGRNGFAYIVSASKEGVLSNTHVETF